MARRLTIVTGCRRSGARQIADGAALYPACRADGTGKADVEKPKIMLGPSQGEPIIVHDNPERLDLFISEGIEDAASIAVATGSTCWAAGSAGRIAALMPLTRGFDNLFIAADELAGEHYSAPAKSAQT